MNFEVDSTALSDTEFAHITTSYHYHYVTKILFTMCLVFCFVLFWFAPNYFCNKKSTVGIASRARPGPISSKTKGMRARDRRLVAARLTPLFLPKKLLAFLPQPCEIHVFPRSKINATPLTVSYYLTTPYLTYCYINAKNMELIKLDV